MGFSLHFPIGSAELLEERGFGACYRLGQHGALPLAEHYTITVKFPRDGFETRLAPVTSLKVPLPSEVKENNKHLMVLHVTLNKGEWLTVEGFQKPFSNPGHPSDAYELSFSRPLLIMKY